MTNEEKIAQKFHDTYEFLAPEYGYITKEETREWDSESPNGKLMIATVKAVMCGLVKQMDDGEKVREKYQELIYQVQTKHPNETRHETALRYIMEREISKTLAAGQAQQNNKE